MKPLENLGRNPRRTVALMAIALGLVLCLLVSVNLYHERQAMIAGASTRTHDFAELLAEHAHQSFDRVGQTLVRTRDRLASQGKPASIGAAALARLLREQIAPDDMIASLGLVGPGGAWVVSTQQDEPPALKLADHVGAAGPGVQVGTPLKARDGAWLIPVSTRLDSPGAGAPAMWVVALVRAGDLQALYKRIDVGQAGFVTLFNRQGWILARSPHIDALMQRHWLDTPMFRQHLPQANTGTVRQVVVADGVERIYSYGTVPDLPLVVSVGMSLTELLAPWRQRVTYVAMGLALALGALALAVFALDRQLRQKELAQAKSNRLASIIENTSDLVITSDADGNFLYANAAARHAVGIEDGDKVRTYRALDFIPAERWKFVQDVARPAALRDGFWHGEGSIRLKGGGELLVSQVLLPHLDEFGKPVSYTDMLRDITERKRIELELRQVNRRMEMASEVAAFGAWEWDLETSTMQTTGSLPALLGDDQASFVPTQEQWLERIHPEDRAEVARKWDAVVSGQSQDYEYQARVRHRLGHDIWVGVVARVFSDRGDGRPSRIIGVTRDITEHKREEARQEQLEEQLREAQKMEAMGTLAGGIAHDFNNIVAVILGNAALANKDLAGGHVQALQLSLGEITKSAHRAKTLVQQLLTLSSRQVMSRKPVPICGLIRDTESKLRETLPGHLKLEVSCDPDIGRATIDPAQISQVLLNLAANATRAIGNQPGELRIEFDRVPLNDAMVQLHLRLELLRQRLIEGAAPGAIPTVLRLRVRDTGIGMDDSVRQRVFEPFFTTKGEGQGAGLGLSVARGIVLAHGGEITVDSEPGEGATFTIYLPSAAAGD